MPNPSRRIPSNDPPSDDTLGEDRAADGEQPVENLAAAQRRKKLAAIKKAVDAGEYDSEDVLDDALKSILRHLDDGPK